MKYQINLLQEKEKDISGKIVYFALHYLRYILVLTQIVVIGVFFYRFKIDQEVIDLRDELKQKEEIVLVSEPLLQEAQAIDLKTRETREILIRQGSFQQMLSYLLSVFPSGMKITKLEIGEKGLSFEGITTEPQLIKMFWNKLQTDKAFKIIELGSIKREDGEFRCPFILNGFVAK